MRRNYGKYVPRLGRNAIYVPSINHLKFKFKVVIIMEDKNYAKFINFMAELIEKYGDEVLAEIQEENNEVKKTAN